MWETPRPCYMNRQFVLLLGEPVQPSADISRCPLPGAYFLTFNIARLRFSLVVPVEARATGAAVAVAVRLAPEAPARSPPHR